MEKSQKMGLIGSGDSGKYFSENGVNRKIGKAKIPRNCSGRKSDRNPAARNGCSKMGIVGSGDSGENFPEMA